MVFIAFAVALGIVLAPIVRAGFKLLGLLVLLFIIIHIWNAS